VTLNTLYLKVLKWYPISYSISATRPPVEETSAFLKALLTAHGKDFLVKVFGPKAKDELAGMGGVDKVAVALSREFRDSIFQKMRKIIPIRSENVQGRKEIGLEIVFEHIFTKCLIHI
ncbi:unnamed protein product, partial [Nippostrongylus brasiliensis]|uniref:KH_dom_type_1 domain-containing protein n=1 Tax=Nippostrongylus brasiliensis TaxID=27835 RepID=A0A0N4XLJ7_NIPBR